MAAAPTEQELEGLIQSHIREEVLYREAPARVWTARTSLYDGGFGRK
jgi:hypothetical protein